MLKLVDLLGITKKTMVIIKFILLLIKGKDEPNEFILGTFEEWQQIQPRKT